MKNDENPPEKEPSIQSKGGDARAKSMSKEERAESAAKAAKARWAKQLGLPKATHMGDMDVPGLGSISCANLDNGDRVISDRSLALGLKARGGGEYWKKRKAKQDDSALLPEYLSNSILSKFISDEIREKLSKSISYVSLSGDLANGIKAELLPQICDIWITANNSGALTTESLKQTAERAYILMKSFAAVGVIALVDEATGFQYERPRRDLEEQLKKFLSEELRRYVGAFPTEYFKHLCRLRGVELRPDMRLPLYFGNLTNDLIYRRIAPGLLLKLKERKLERGKASNKLYNWLSEDVGFRALLIHMGQVIGTMKRHTSYDEFLKDLNRIAPPYPETPGLFDDPKDWEEPKT